MQQWLQTPPGRYLLDWEQAAFDTAVSDLFGYHALQLGLPSVDALRCNRMPHRWVAASPTDTPAPGACALVTDCRALPFEENSLDLVALPHTLEITADPHAALREVERVLMPEGRVVICGLNPMSLWGLRQRRGHLYRRLGLGQLFLPKEGEFIGYWRLRDWLRLLNFEVQASHFGCWRPAFANPRWLDRCAWMDRLGARWLPIVGAAYLVVAVKRVRGARLMGPAWAPAAAASTAPMPLANRSRRERGDA